MEKVRLGDCATFINGYAFKPKEWSQNGIPIIRIQNLTGSMNKLNYYDGKLDSKYIINNGDILISWSASLGIFEWKKGKAYLNQHIFKVEFNKKNINKKYFVYLIKSKINEMKKNTHGSTMKHITKSDFDKIEIFLPNIQNQQEISNKLDKVQEIIDLRKKQIEELDELIKSQFVEMFGTPFINEKKWKTGNIKDLVNEVRYGTSRPATKGGKLKYLRMNNITYDGKLDLSDLKYIDIPEKELDKCTTRNGDILFNRTNSRELVGKTCVYNMDERMVIAGFIIRIRVNKDANPYFISTYLNTSYLKTKLYNICKNASGQSNINAQELQNIEIYIPPIKLQNDFEEIVKKINIKQLILEKSLKETEELQESLMNIYFGE